MNLPIISCVLLGLSLFGLASAAFVSFRPLGVAGAGRLSCGVLAVSLLLIGTDACCDSGTSLLGLPPLLLGIALLGMACHRPMRWGWLQLSVAAPMPVALLLTAAALAAAWVERRDGTLDPLELYVLNSLAPSGLVRIRDATEVLATTDCGLPIQLHACAAADSSPMSEFRMPRTIATASPSPHYNCHGWVFSGGRYIVPCEAVELILVDNGYQVVSSPRRGDLIVYRDSGGAVCHTGIVKVVGPDHYVLLESKWGNLGRYLHEPQHSKYSGTFAYYRSPRRGHLLSGLHSEPRLTR